MRLWLPALLAALFLLVGAGVAHAQEGAQAPEQAGLVIVTGDDEPATYCVDIAPGEEITGNELLQRAGVKVVADQSAMGASICSLNGTGCAFPADACFCQCQGTPCTYWSYWRQDEAGAWQYATAGAANTRIRAGTVEGWVWGEGTTQSAIAPPALALADICTPDVEAAPAEGGAPEPTRAIARTPAAVAAAAAATPLDEVATPADVATNDNNSWALAGLAALVVIPVAAILLLRRRKDKA